MHAPPVLPCNYGTGRRASCISCVCACMHAVHVQVVHLESPASLPAGHPELALRSHRARGRPHTSQSAPSIRVERAQLGVGEDARQEHDAQRHESDDEEGHAPASGAGSNGFGCGVGCGCGCGCGWDVGIRVGIGIGIGVGRGVGRWGRERVRARGGRRTARAARG